MIDYIFDFGVLLRNVEGATQEQLLQIYALYQNELDELIDQLSSPPATVDIEKLGFSIHNLVSSSGLIGAITFSEYLSLFEARLKQSNKWQNFPETSATLEMAKQTRVELDAALAKYITDPT